MALRAYILLAGLTAAAGCAFPQPPPPMSMAKFARPPSDRNRMGFSTGVAMHLDREEDATFALYPVEAGLGVSIGDRYDLGVSVGNLLGTAEGNFAIIDGNLRLGIIHGLGLGMWASQTDQAVFTQFTGGTFLQTGRRHAFFGALKYTYATDVGSETFLPTHFFTSSIGFLPSGAVKVTPELIVNHARWDEPGSAETERAWTVVIGIAVMTHYGRAR